MKLAILGSSPIALEAALRFHLHGAAVTWFNEKEFEWEAHHEFENNWSQFTSPQGWELLGKERPSVFSWELWTTEYLRPLTDILRSFQEVKPHKVTSITKRFLRLDEVIPEKSRFHDLFRVIYEQDPKAFIDAQRETDPELYKKLTSEFVESLQSTLELYEDFDGVIDLRRLTIPLSLNESGRALGEYRFISEKLLYAKEALEFTEGPFSSDVREIALVGTTELTLKLLLNLAEWLKDPRSMLFVITTEETPFESVLEQADSLSLKKYADLMKFIDDEYDRERTQFHEKLRQWQELDDFVQVKYPKPAEPLPRLNYFSAHNVTAVDQLIDRKKMFLTLEHPDFRVGKLHPDNNHLELKTIGCDQILVSTGLTRQNVAILQHGELGYWNLEPQHPNVSSAWEKDIHKLEGIEHEIFKLFTPA